VLYGDSEQFALGGSKALRSSTDDQATLVGAGVTTHECLRAADILQQDGFHVRVIDCYSVKPIDTGALTSAAATTGGRFVIAEDHHPEGGLGSAVTDALIGAGSTELRVRHLAVSGMPGSGSGTELMAWAGIDAAHIADAARDLISST
jgi:transketolase